MNDLRARAEAEAEGWPALMLAAERLAAQAAPGAHGLRRAGSGEEFWQYRTAAQSDDAAAIDWRRSARGDADFVRDRERLTPQAAAIWVAGGEGMDWRGGSDRPTKADHARLLALTMTVLLLRGGERVGLLGAAMRPGRAQLPQVARALLTEPGGAAPDPAALRPASRALLIGDWLGSVEGLQAFLAQAAALGVRGAILQVLDPAEEAFPYAGAVLFRAPAGGAAHDTRDAGGLRAAYLTRLAARRAQLSQMAEAAGWRFGTHSTAAPPSEALLWLSGAMSA